MPYTRKKIYKPSTVVLSLLTLIVLIAVYYYLCFYDPNALAGLIGHTPLEDTTDRQYLNAVRWGLTILLFVANVYLLKKVPTWIQIVVTIAELFALIALFATTFDLSFEFIASKLPLLIARGITTTILVSAASIMLAMVLALMSSVARLSNNGIAIGISRFYTSLFRGVPLLLQIFMLYMGLPQLGIIISPIPSGIAALALCYGAYMSEVFRAGIQSIPEGQWEAAQSLGMHKRKIMQKVVLPQAMKLIIPPVGNQFIAMLKDSSLVSVIGVWELTYLASTLGTRDFRNIEMLMTAAAIYWTLSVCLEMLQSRVERRFTPPSRQ